LLLLLRKVINIQDELMEFLDTIKANSASTESTVLGYKVKVSYGVGKIPSVKLMH
jgi:hypothetical protein